MKKLMVPTIISLNFISLAFAAQQVPLMPPFPPITAPAPSMPPMPSFPSTPPSTQPMANTMTTPPQTPPPLPISSPVPMAPLQPVKSAQETIKNGALLVAENDTTLMQTADPEIKQWFASCQESLKQAGAIVITIDERLQKIRDSMRVIDQQTGTSTLENSAILGEVKDIYTALKNAPVTPALTQTITAEEAKLAQAQQDITAIQTLKTKLTGIQNDVNKQQTSLLQQLTQARTATYALLNADKAAAQVQHHTVVQIQQEVMRIQDEVIQKLLPSFESTAQELNQKMSLLPLTINALQQQARQLDQQSQGDSPKKGTVSDDPSPATKATTKKRRTKKSDHTTLSYVQDIATSAASLALDCVQTATSTVICMFEKPDAPTPLQKADKKTTAPQESSIFKGLFWKTLDVAHNITSKLFSAGVSLARSLNAFLYEKFSSTAQKDKQTRKKKAKKEQAVLEDQQTPPTVTPPQETSVELKTEELPPHREENMKIASPESTAP